MFELIWIMSWIAACGMGVAFVAGVWVGARRKSEAQYQYGVQDGQQFETEWACEDAVIRERLAVQRRMHDAGRRNVARPGTKPSVIRKAQIGLPKVNQTTPPD